MTVDAAPLTASCLLPLAAPWLSKSFDASAMAIPISFDCILPPLLLLLDPPPEVKFLIACMAAAAPRELAGREEALPFW